MNNNKKIKTTAEPLSTPHTFFNENYRDLVKDLFLFLKPELSNLKGVNKFFKASVDAYELQVANQNFSAAKIKISKIYKSPDHMQIINQIIDQLNLTVPTEYYGKLSHISIRKEGKVGEVTLKAETLYEEDPSVIIHNVNLKNLIDVLLKCVVEPNKETHQSIRKNN